MELNDTERAALSGLAGALGTVLVMDVTSEVIAPDAPARPSAPAWDAAAPRPGKCGCCGLRRDLVAYSGLDATAADLCFRCGSDRAQGLAECTSKPRATVSVAHLEWTVEQ